MRELIGWFLVGLGCLCGLRILAYLAEHGMKIDDWRSVLKREVDPHTRIVEIPILRVWISGFLGLILLGMMFLIGMPR